MPIRTEDLRRRAFVLLIVISFMAILSILATSFAMMSRIERNVSANMVDLVRARMLAHAGVERAVVELRTTTGGKGWEALSEPWGCSDPPSTPMGSLANPSFKRLTTAYGRAYSGELSATYEANGDTYVLRITDAASRLYVNGRQPNLAQMLDTLGSAIQMEGLGANPCPPGTGARIIAARNLRPGGVFANKDEIEPIVGTTSWALFRNFVTEHAWVDNSVLQPNPQSVIGSYVDGPIAENLTYSTAVQATGGGRAPVNVNTASVPVLMVVITGLQGRWIEASNARFRRTQTAAIPISRAQIIARRIAQDRAGQPFKSWQDFIAWIDAYLPPGGPGQPNLESELIKAMVNPNTLFNKFNPNRVTTNWVGKEELTYTTTEMCFSSMGYFEVEALGRVTSTGGVERATRHIKAFLKAYDVLRHTSQSDFVTAMSASTSTGRTRTFPENMSDFNRPSVLDGQVCIKEQDPAAGATFQSTFDSTLLGTDGFRRTNFIGYDDCKEDVSVFASTNRAASDLFPDGVYMSEFRSKLLHYSSYYNLHPKDGTMEWWMKPDRLTYTGALQGVCVIGIPHAPGKVYRTIIGNQPGFGFLVNGGHASQVYPPGGMYATTRYRSDLPWTGPDYFLMGSANPGNRLMWGDWHHVAVSWNDYINYRIYFDGVKVIDYRGYYVSPPGSVGLNSSPQTDEMQFGSYVWTARWQSPWQPPTVPWWNNYPEATIDSINAYHAQTLYTGGNFSAPDRYTRSNGGTTYVSDFTIPAGSTPAVRVNAIFFTSYRPTTDYLGNRFTNARPEIQMEWFNPQTGSWSAEFGDAGVPVGVSVNRGATLRYRAKWYDRGITPNNTPAYLDDVTVTFTGSLQFLSYVDDPN